MVTVNPFSRWKYREWDNAKWGEVLDRLWDKHRIPAVLIGSPEKAAACHEIITERKGRTINLAGKTTLSELAAVISMCSLHLGVNSAAPHVAATVGTPTVTIHGTSDWRAWRIVDECHKVGSATKDCVPCSMIGCGNAMRSPCLEQLQAGPMVMAAEQILLNCTYTQAERIAS